MEQAVKGQLIDIHERRTYPAEIIIANGRIVSVTEIDEAPPQYLLPGFVDAHIHIESSMVVPVSFAAAAVVHGTVATVSDPHEIANVCGLPGVQFMLDNAKLTPFKFFFGAPSCVPATVFETAGATLGVADVDLLLQKPDIWYLSEMMNFPGVLHGEPGVLGKIAAAQKHGKPVDGHAPGMRGADVVTYAAAGITTDHECTTLPEALEKIAAGMNILIREGSAARNYEALSSLLQSHPEKVMLCSDDKHPDDLVAGHINLLVQRSLQKGYDLYDVLRAACLHPVMHYRLPVGLLRVGDPADFIVVENLERFQVKQTFIDGHLVYDQRAVYLPKPVVEPINQFAALPVQTAQLRLQAPEGLSRIRVIEAIEGQLLTRELLTEPLIKDGFVVADTDNDNLKLIVVNRYAQQEPPAIAFIRNFGLKAGAIASTIAHDCHNIVAVGTSDEALAAAINGLIEAKGGISVVAADGTVTVLPLPVAGLMATGSVAEVAEQYTAINKQVQQLGCTLHAPFMVLSFMALLVIPALKLSDKGLFDGSVFSFVPVLVTE